MRSKSTDPKDDAIGCLVLLGIGLGIFVLFEAWPWDLLLPIAGYLVALIAKPGLRKKFWLSFTKSDVDTETGKHRSVLMRILFAAAVLATFVCVDYFSTENFTWCLIPLSFLCLSYRLRSLRKLAGRWIRLRTALTENIFELLFIAFIVLAIYSSALVWLRNLPLENTTLGTLRLWDERVKSIHGGLEHLEPGFSFLLLGLALLLVVRIVVEVHLALLRVSQTAVSALGKGAKWFERISTAAALASSLTFLGTGEQGVAARISVALKKATSEYESFQSKVEEAMEVEVRRASISKSWNARPAPLKATLSDSWHFEQKRAGFDALEAKAQERFQMSVALPIDVPLAMQMKTPDQPSSVSVPEATWTPARIDGANDEAGQLEQEENKDEIGKDRDDVEEKLFEQMIPNDYFFDRLPALALLKVHYPAFGELLDAIVSAAAESSFRSAKAAIVQTVIAEKRQGSPSPLSDLIRAQVPGAIAQLHIDFSSLSPAWASATTQKLDHYASEIDQAEDQLERTATARQAAEVQVALNKARERNGKLRAIAAVLKSKELAIRAAELGEWITQTEEIARSWPALRNATDEQKRRLEKIEDAMAPKPTDEISQLLNAKFKSFETSEDLDPALILTNLKLCAEDSAIDAIVGRSSVSNLTTLKTILGHEYFSYLIEKHAANVLEQEKWQDELRRMTDAINNPNPPGIHPVDPIHPDSGYEHPTYEQPTPIE
jgi:hypothetical protein